MRILGSYLIGTLQARTLAPGASIDVPRDQQTSRKLAGAQIGDVLWVKEPWVLVKSRQHGRQHIRDVIVGPVGTPPPEYMRPFFHELRAKPMSALALERGDSRATLEVMGILPDAVRCQIHFKNVIEFMKAVAA